MSETPATVARQVLEDRADDTFQQFGSFCSARACGNAGMIELGSNPPGDSDDFTVRVHPNDYLNLAEFFTAAHEALKAPKTQPIKR